MNNANVGGNRGAFGGGEPGDFGAQIDFGAPKGFGTPEVFGAPENFEAAFNTTPNEDMANKATMETVDPELIEVRPLAADGTTEGEIGKLAVKLSGEMLDEASAKEVKEKIVEFKDNPYELQNYRDEAMVEFLRDNFGRIFGDASKSNTGNSDGEGL